MQTARANFLESLKGTTFGKIICINLFRSARIETLGKHSIVNFLNLCSKAFALQREKEASETDSALALIIAKAPTSREALLEGALFPCPVESVPLPTQYITVLRCEDIKRLMKLEQTERYMHSIDSEERLKDLISAADNQEIRLGGKEGRCFWLTNALLLGGENQELVQLYRNKLGLCHFEEKDDLAVMSTSHEKISPTQTLFRPTALHGIHNPAFLAARDNEINAPAKLPGTTRDLSPSVEEEPIYGVYEWLCQSVNFNIKDADWYFLGKPQIPSCDNDKEFHRKILFHLEKTTPAVDALSYLSNI